MSRARKRVKMDAEGEEGEKSLHPDLRTGGAEARERGRVGLQAVQEQYTEQEKEEEKEGELQSLEISRAKPARRRHQGLNTLQLLSGATHAQHAAHTLTINSKRKSKSAGTEVGDTTQPVVPGPRFAPVGASKGGGGGKAEDRLLTEFVETELRKRRQVSESRSDDDDHNPPEPEDGQTKTQPSTTKQKANDQPTLSDQQSLVAHGKLIEVPVQINQRRGGANARPAQQTKKATKSAADAERERKLNIEGRLNSVLAESSISSAYLRPPFETSRSITLEDIEQQLEDEEAKRSNAAENRKKAQAERVAREKIEMQRLARRAADSSTKR